MTTRHNDLVREIRLFLSEVGALSINVDTPGLVYDRMGNPMKIGTKGVLDIAACLKGRFVAVDAKTGKDRLKPAQAKFAKAVERSGGIAFAAWSVDDVRDRLTKEGLIDA